MYLIYLRPEREVCLLSCLYDELVRLKAPCIQQVVILYLYKSWCYVQWYGNQDNMIDRVSSLKGLAFKIYPRCVLWYPIPFRRSANSIFNIIIMLVSNGELPPVRYAGGTNPSTSFCPAPGCAIDRASSTHTLSYSSLLSKYGCPANRFNSVLTCAGADHRSPGESAGME